MKRFLCLLLALLTLAGSASAESLKMTLGVPDHVTLPPFTTSTGKTAITIDAVVEMPDVASVNIYEYLPSSITVDQALVMARLVGHPEITEITFTRREWGDGVSQSVDESFTDSVSNIYNFSLTNSYWRGKPHGGRLQFDRYDGPDYAFVLSPRAYDAARENCAYSREEARQMAIDFAAQVAPELKLHLEGVIDSRRDGEDTAYPTAYRYVFTREVDGIPVTVTSEWLGAGQNDDAHMPWCHEERLTLTVADCGYAMAYLDAPHVVGGIVEADVTDLVPFETILDIALTILPLKMVTREDNQWDYTLDVDRITFGYMRVQKAYTPGEFELVPVWDFFAHDSWMMNGEMVPVEDIDASFLTVDARTGLVIDRQYGY